MADKTKTKLPNMKICIYNTDSDDSCSSAISDDDELSLDSDEDIDETQDSGIKEKGEDEETELDISTDTKKDVEFNVLLGPTSKKRSEIRPFLKTYENKAGSFVTGIDLTNQVEMKKKEERAKRFGIEISEENEASISDLYKSLGIREEDLSRKDERGIRLEAIHFRGVDDMNTKDIFAYFKEFGPAGVEWIDDSSCNIVWLDKVTAARAMTKLSRSYDVNMQQGEGKETEKKVAKRNDSMEANDKKDKKDKRDKNNSETDKLRNTSNKTRDAKSLRDGEEPMEEGIEDEDTLDLIEDRRKTVIKDKCSDAERESKTAEKESKSDREDGELTDDSDSEDDGGQKGNKGEGKSQLMSKNILWPPGKWRLGITTSKARCLFMRFATKADAKLPGAERRSRYYQIYGNPNYGGIKGLISTSRKRKYNATRMLSDVEEAREAMDKAQRKIVSYAGVDMFTDVVNKDDDVRNVEHADSAWGVGPKKHVSDRPKFIFEKLPEEEKPRFILEQSELGQKHAKDVSEDSDDSEVDEEELERLLGPPVKIRTMRMYADDVEEEIKKKKTLQQGDLTITADLKRGSSPVRIKDARELIKGLQAKPKEIDIRSRLQLRTRLSPPVWDDENSQSSHELDWRAAADDNDNDNTSSPDARHVKSRVSRDRSPDSRLHRTIQNKGTDLRAKLDTRKKTGSSKFQNMKIEVFD